MQRESGAAHGNARQFQRQGKEGSKAEWERKKLPYFQGSDFHTAAHSDTFPSRCSGNMFMPSLAKHAFSHKVFA